MFTLYPYIGVTRARDGDKHMTPEHPCRRRRRNPKKSQETTGTDF